MNVSSNKKVLVDLLEDRSRPLITISNHRCNTDDPLLWSTNLIKRIKFCIYKFIYFSNFRVPWILSEYISFSLYPCRSRHLLYQEYLYEVLFYLIKNGLNGNSLEYFLLADVSHACGVPAYFKLELISASTHFRKMAGYTFFQREKLRKILLG